MAASSRTSPRQQAFKSSAATNAATATSCSLLFFLLLLVLAILTTPQSSQALQCFCNEEACTNETCETTNNVESTCFKSVVRTKSPESGAYSLGAVYGCISGGDGLLGPLQCKVDQSFVKYVEPVFMRCCKEQDFCNEQLPDPTLDQDDGWWNPDNFPAPFLDVRMPFWLAYTLIGCIVVVALYIIAKLVQYLVAVCKSRSTKASVASTWFLEADLKKFQVNLHADHHHDLHHQHANSTSYSSSRSYSISDDLCKKSDAPSPHHGEESFSPEEFTSGIGDRILNERTMARAVGFGHTDPVGDGRFGRVFRGQYHGEDVAVKAFRTIDQISWQREDKILRALNHENVVRFIASEVTSPDNESTEIWMFLEYIPYGSLCDYLDHNEVLGQQQAVKILYSIINGLNYLHEDYAQSSKLYKPSIAHRDIKSKNILMKTPEVCCIADFGHALIKEDENRLDYGSYDCLQVGTVRFMAPEILQLNTTLNYRHFSTFAKADLYQYGLIAWEVCHRTALDILHPAGDHKLPYDGWVPHNPRIDDMIKIVCDEQYRPPRYDKWEKYPMMKRLSELMVECWRPNPRARMETLGVKKKIREMYDQATQISINMNNFQPNHKFLIPTHTPRNDRDRTKSSDVTL